MERILFTIALVCVNILQMNAQSSQSEKTLTAFDRIHIDAAVSGTTKQHDVQSIRMGLNVGYEFVTRVYTFVHVENNLALQKTEGTRTFFNSPVIGGGLGYRLFGGNGGKRESGTRDCLDLRIMAGCSVGNCDWKQTIYDAGFQYYFKGSRMTISPTIGLGYRFTDSRTTGLRDQHALYASIGLRF